MRRREFMRYLSVLAGAGAMDWERLADALDAPRRVDERLLDDMAALSAHYARHIHSMAPTSLLPAVRGHLAMLQGLLRGSPGLSVERRLRSLAGAAARQMGWLAYLLENRGDARAYYNLAEQLARAAGDGPLGAQVLGDRSLLYSTLPSGGWNGEPDVALGLLNQAIASVGAGGPPLPRAWLLARRAEEHAARGAARAAHLDLGHAGRALARGHGGHGGFLDHWNANRLAGYRGHCLQLLDEPDEAVSVLERALAAVDQRLVAVRLAMTVDLAAAHVQRREIDRACALLVQSLDEAQAVGMAEPVQSIRGVRRRLTPWHGAPEVRQLDERLRLAS